MSSWYRSRIVILNVTRPYIYIYEATKWGETLCGYCTHTYKYEIEQIDLATRFLLLCLLDLFFLNSSSLSKCIRLSGNWPLSDLNTWPLTSPNLQSLQSITSSELRISTEREKKLNSSGGKKRKKRGLSPATRHCAPALLTMWFMWRFKRPKSSCGRTKGRLVTPPDHQSTPLLCCLEHEYRWGTKWWAVNRLHSPSLHVSRGFPRSATSQKNVYISSLHYGENILNTISVYIMLIVLWDENETLETWFQLEV